MLKTHRDQGGLSQVALCYGSLLDTRKPNFIQSIPLYLYLNVDTWHCPSGISPYKESLTEVTSIRLHFLNSMFYSNIKVVMMIDYETNSIHQAPVVQRLDDAIIWINFNPPDGAIVSTNTYPLVSDLTAG